MKMSLGDSSGQTPVLVAIAVMVGILLIFALVILTTPIFNTTTIAAATQTLEDQGYAVFTPAQYNMLAKQLELLQVKAKTDNLPGSPSSTGEVNNAATAVINHGDVNWVVPNPLPISPTPLPVIIASPTPVPVTVPTPLPVTIPTPVPVIQNAIMDPLNSSSANLNAGATFTGTAVNTLGVNCIQVSLKADRNCNVYVEQSPEGTNWDIVDVYSYVAIYGGASWNVAAVNSWYRVRVTNTNASATTYLRLQSVLCPIESALPRSLTNNGRLVTNATLSDDYGFGVENTPMGEMRVVEPEKLVGTNFIGTVVDPNFLTVTNTNGGTTTQAGGQLTLQTNGTANGATFVSTVRRGRYVPSFSMRFRGLTQLSAGVVNNTRRWGVCDYTTAPTVTDGAWFEYSGTTLSVVTMKGGVTNRVSSGSFNGVFGSDYILDTSSHTFEIYWTNMTIWFVIGQDLLHKMSFPSSTWSNTTTLYAFADNINSGGITSNNVLNSRIVSIDRLGPLQNAPIYKHLTTGTTICKYGAGTLHSVIVGTPANQTITLYDNTAASGNVMAVITLGNNTSPIELHYDMDFYTGLTIVISGAIDMTVVYE